MEKEIEIIGGDLKIMVRECRIWETNMVVCISNSYDEGKLLNGDGEPYNDETMAIDDMIAAYIPLQHFEKTQTELEVYVNKEIYGATLHDIKKECRKKYVHWDINGERYRFQAEYDSSANELYISVWEETTDNDLIEDDWLGDIDFMEPTHDNIGYFCNALKNLS